MAEVIHRFKILFIAFCLVIIGLLIWLGISRQKVEEMPSRGVFVLEGNICELHDYSS